MCIRIKVLGLPLQRPQGSGTPQGSQSELACELVNGKLRQEALKDGSQLSIRWQDVQPPHYVDMAWLAVAC